jgi:hypothetical protein
MGFRLGFGPKVLRKEKKVGAAAPAPPALDPDLLSVEGAILSIEGAEIIMR